MNLLWIGLKALLSLVLLATAAGLLWLFAHRPHEHVLIGVASVALFMGALPWVRFEPGRRELALAGIVASLGLIFVGVETLLGGRAHPHDCAVRRAWCALDNLLYALGGPMLAAAPFVLAGLVLLFFAGRAALRRS